MHKVFVYGTLRPGTSPVVRIPAAMYDLGGFPGVNLGGEGTIAAEPLLVTDAVLRRLDHYEGYNEKKPDSSFYRREPYEDGFIYVFNGDLSGRFQVPGGDWLKYKGQSEGRAASLLLEG